MAVSSISPISGSVLLRGDSFSFELDAGATPSMIQVTVDGTVSEIGWDLSSGFQPGFDGSATVDGTAYTISLSRVGGFEGSPFTVTVDWVVGVSASQESWSYVLQLEETYPELMQPRNPERTGSGEQHGDLDGLDADDHPQYHNDARGDARYAPLGHDHDLDYAPLVHTHEEADITDLDKYTQAEVDTLLLGKSPSGHGHAASEVTIAALGAADHDTVQELINTAIGVGITHGGEITDNGDGTVAISTGSGFIRAVDDDEETVYATDWSAVASQALTDNEVNYLYIEYNAGTPQVAVSLTLPTDLNTNLLLGAVQRDGLFLHPTPYRYIESNLAREINRRLYNVDGATHSSGAAISESGTLNFAITEGDFYLGLNQGTFTAEDTAVASTFLDFYRDGAGGWTVSGGNTAIDNLQYDDGTGTLATLGNNRYGVHWVYVSPWDQDIYVVYGRGSYTASQAAEATSPGDLPEQIDGWHGILAGKIVVQKSATSFTTIESAFVKLFLSGGVSDHGDLSGLADDDHSQYSLADGTRGGNVVGPATATDAAIAVFDGTTGKLIKNSTGTIAQINSNTGHASGSGGGHSDVAANSAAVAVRVIGPGPTVTHQNVMLFSGTGGYWAEESTIGESDLIANVAHVAGDGSDHADVATNTSDIADRVEGPATATDNRIVTWDGASGKLVQDSVVGLEPTTGVMTNVGTEAMFVLAEQTGGMPTHSPGYGKLWVDNTAPASLMFTDDVSTDHPVVLAPTSVVDNRFVTWDGTTGHYVQSTSAALQDSGAIVMTGSACAVEMAERSSAPTNSAGYGKLWANSAFAARPYWTEDGTADRPILCGPNSIGASVTDNMMARWDSTSGGVVQDSKLYQGDDGNTTITGSSADLSIQERATGPGSAGGYSRLWTHTESPTRLCVTDDSGYKAKLGYKDIRLSCRADIGGTTNYWYTWNTAGPHYDYIWSHSASGGTSYNLSNCWMNTTCMYFPRKTRIISVESCLTYKDATNSANIDFYMVHSAATEAQTSANSINTCAYWLPATFAAVANKRYLSGKWTLSDTTIPAGSQVWILHRRSTSTVVAADPFIDYTIHYIEEAD